MIPLNCIKMWIDGNYLFFKVDSDNKIRKINADNVEVQK